MVWMATKTALFVRPCLRANLQASNKKALKLSAFLCLLCWLLFLDYHFLLVAGCVGLCEVFGATG